MRGWIADAGNYSAAVKIGEVIASRHPDYAVGEIVTGWFGWQERSAVGVSAIVRRVTETDLPLSLALGVLGINGVTAHLALTMIGDPQPGQTVLVSTAAGAVGSTVGQIATILGCRAVGIAGGPAKTEQCRTKFGYADAVDYKAPDLGDALSGSDRRAQATPRSWSFQKGARRSFFETLPDGTSGNSSITSTLFGTL